MFAYAAYNIENRQPSHRSEPLYFSRALGDKLTLRNYLFHHRTRGTYFPVLWETFRRLGQHCVRVGSAKGILLTFETIVCLCRGVMGISPRTAKRHIAILVDAGLIRKLSDGYAIVHFAVDDFRDTEAKVEAHTSRRKAHNAQRQKRFRQRQKVSHFAPKMALGDLPPCPKVPPYSSVISQVCETVTLPTKSPEKKPVLKHVFFNTKQSSPADTESMHMSQEHDANEADHGLGHSEDVVAKAPQDKSQVKSQGAGEGDSKAKSPKDESLDEILARIHRRIPEFEKMRHDREEREIRESAILAREERDQEAWEDYQKTLPPVVEKTPLTEANVLKLVQTDKAGPSLTLNLARHLQETHSHVLGKDINLMALVKEQPTYEVARQAFEATACAVKEGRVDSTPGQFLMGTLRRMSASTVQ